MCSEDALSRNWQRLIFCGFIAGAAILFLGGKLGINNGILTVLIVLSGILINRVFFVMDKKKAAQNA